ncbi:hypothetical protein M9458_045110, partial [Cirrhinus mrigala]
LQLRSQVDTCCYYECLGNGQILKRHVDQIRIQHVDELQGFAHGCCLKFPVLLKWRLYPTVPASPITKEKEAGKEFQLPDKLDTPAAPQLRHSSRERRPPIRL